jgi:outer membrane protein, multidrug efflux system
MNKTNTFLSLALAALLTACATPQLPATPTTTPASRWQATLPHGGDPQALAGWWQRFDDPLLAELIARAQRESASLAQAAARVREARAGLTEARARQRPGLNLQAQASRGSAANGNFTPATQAGADAQAQWEVDLFGGTRAQVAAADARAQGAELGWHEARVSLAAEVAQTYVNLRSCEAQLAVLQEDVASQNKIAELTREKVRVGFEAPANGHLAQAAAADARNRALASQADCAALVQALSVLTVQPASALAPQLAPRTAALPQPQAFAVQAVPAQVLAQRPDVAVAERDLVAAAADVGVADAARFPRISIGGNVGYGLLRAGGGQQDGLSWGFGPTLTLPIFDGGTRAAQQDAARARYDAARAGLDAKLRGAVAEVEESLIRLDAAQKRETDAQMAAQGFKDYFAAAEARWRIGTGSLIDREDARRTALNAQSALLNVQRERVAAWITLYRSVGGGWSTADALQSR